MRFDHRRIHRECTRKVPYRTQEAAEHHVMRQRDVMIWKIYKCPHCRSWHIAHRNDMDYNHIEQVVLDFETASCCDLKKSGAWRYAEDITTEVLCLAYAVRDTHKLWVPGMSVEGLRYMAENPNFIFVAHNAGFEKAIWRRIMVPLFDLPDVPNSRWDDTLAACAMRALPLGLESATLVLRLAAKDTEGSSFTKRLSKPNKRGYYDRTEESLARVYRYCQQDVIAECDLRERLGPLPQAERNVWLLDQRINERGIHLDLAFIKAAQQVVERATTPLAAEFSRITGGLKVGQVAKIKAWVENQGVFIASLGKESIDSLLGEENDEEDLPSHNSNLPEPVYRALYIRSVIGSASIKKLSRMEQCVGMDGRVRGTMQYHGATTGRWSGRLFQPHNFPRGTIKLSPDVMVNAIMSGDPETVQMLVGAPIESVISSLRHAIIAAPGHVLLSGDFAGVEARLVLALAGQYDKTEIMAKGQDVYCDMAQSIYKRPINKKDDPEERQVGKNSVLGLGFGMGWRKFKGKYGEGLSEEFCQEIVRTYREDWAPKVPALWWAIQDAALGAVRTGKPHDAYGVLYEIQDRWLTARLPSGRRLWYFNPREKTVMVPWKETPQVIWEYETVKTGKWTKVEAFGGLLVENVIQGLARDLMVNAMFKLEKNDFPIILTVHDEIVCEPLAAKADEKAFAQIMEDVPAWAKNIQMPVAVETWKGDRYKK